MQFSDVPIGDLPVCPRCGRRIKIIQPQSTADMEWFIGGDDAYPDWAGHKCPWYIRFIDWVRGFVQ